VLVCLSGCGHVVILPNCGSSCSTCGLVRRPSKKRCACLLFFNHFKRFSYLKIYYKFQKNIFYIGFHKNVEFKLTLMGIIYWYVWTYTRFNTLGANGTRPTPPICIHLEKLLLGGGFPFLIELCQICYELLYFYSFFLFGFSIFKWDFYPNEKLHWLKNITHGNGLKFFKCKSIDMSWLVLGGSQIITWFLSQFLA